MERRFLLAFVLSFFVLYSWSALVPHPAQPKVPQAINYKRVTETKVLSEQRVGQNVILPAAKPPIGEQIQRLESDKFIAEFSNIGGRLCSVLIKGYNASFPTTTIASLSGYADLPFFVEKKDRDTIIYVYENSEVKVSNSYRLAQDDYTIEAKTDILNKTNVSKLVDASAFGLVLDMSKLNVKDGEAYYSHLRDKALLEYVVSSEGGAHRKNNAFKFSAKESKRHLGNVNWVGFRSRYFCAIVKPKYTTLGYSVEPDGEERITLSIESEHTTVPAHENMEMASFIYVGPEKSEKLVKYNFGFEDIKRYYRFELFDAIAKIIYSAMYNINKIIPNWGVCIILISIIVYFSMYPLTLKSMASMRKIQYLQPKIANIRDKYKDNPQKVNAEMMELYRKEKVNPFGGCLPMLLQMPVFIGLYQVLWRSVSFKGANFLWIKDLSEPDRLFVFTSNFPIIGNELNLLPIIMIFVMGAQQRLTSRNMIIADPAQAAQQKMMNIIMPIFLGVVFYKFSSGLTLYFVMFYSFSTFTQWKMSKLPKVA